MPKHIPAAAPDLIAALPPDLCLDFANTRYWRGSDPATETLSDAHGLARWCGEHGLLGDAAAAATIRWWNQHPLAAAAAFQEAIDLREAIYRTLHALSEQRAPASEDFAHLERAMAQAPARTVVASEGAGFGWPIVRHLPPAATELLAPVLWSTADLLVGPRRARLRHCANPLCLWLFVDESKGGKRRWCSMAACGNRAKARRHYLRHKNG